MQLNVQQFFKKDQLTAVGVIYQIQACSFIKKIIVHYKDFAKSSLRQLTNSCLFLKRDDFMQIWPQETKKTHLSCINQFFLIFIFLIPKNHQEKCRVVFWFLNYLIYIYTKTQTGASAFTTSLFYMNVSQHSKIRILRR